MDIYDAADVVQKNIGEPIALIQVDHYFYAVAYRREVEESRHVDVAYSTHRVSEFYCESGHYDMSLRDAYEDLMDRVGLNVPTY